MSEMSLKQGTVPQDVESLRIVYYPDPRLMEVCAPLDAADPNLPALVKRMAELMFQARGVGLAAPQVGLPVRLFLASPSFTPEDLHVYINPRIVETAGTQDGEEGCLSFPSIYCKVRRYETVTIEATGLDGQRFAQTCTDLHARICQHENDHLDGRLLVDRMSAVAKLANRKALRSLEEEFAEAK